MGKEFNLSKKINSHKESMCEGMIELKDVKEFIKLLKEKEVNDSIKYNYNEVIRLENLFKWIDKLCGEKLR